MNGVVQKLDLNAESPDVANEINEAIAAASEAGGGVLEIPSGVYQTGSIFLRSGVTLHLAEGAVLQGTEDREAYASLDLKPLPGRTLWTYPSTAYSLVIAEGQKNIAIEGKGEIRGIGNSPYHGGETARTAFRPNLVVFKDCEEIAVRGVSLKYSSFWTLHMVRCREVDIEGIEIQTHMNRINADGIDPDGCEDVRIRNCRVYSADDPLTIKSTEGDANRRITVEDCEFKSTFGGIKIGTESLGAFEDIRIRRCRLLNSWVGLCLYMKDGGSFKRLVFSDLELTTKAPFSLVIDNTPRFYKTSVPGEIEGLEFRNLAFSGPGRMLAEGYEGHPIRNLRMDNVTFQQSGIVDLTTVKKPNGSGLVELDPDRDIHANRPYFIIGSRIEDFRITNVSITDRQGRLPDGIGFLYLHGCQAGNLDLNGNLRTGAASHLFEDVSGVSFVLNGHAVTRVAENPSHRFSKESMSWVWTDLEVPERNAYVGFRREFTLKEGERARLRVTADSRYVLWVNGQRLGIGPPRAWPAHWEVDEYDLSEVCHEGTNLVAILVLHLGEGTMQYIPNPPGMAAAITIRNGASTPARTIYSDDTWQVKVCNGYVSKAPRMCLQMAFEERYDARKDNSWWNLEEDPEGWTDAKPVLAPHTRLKSRGIPLLHSEEWVPSEISNFQVVRSTPYHWTINLRPYCCPNETLSAPMIYKGYLFTQIYSPVEQDVYFMRPHWYHQGPMFLNGKEIERLPAGFARSAETQHAILVEGWNRLMVPLPDYTVDNGEAHFGVSLFPQFSIDVDVKTPVLWSARGGDEAEENPGNAFAFIGPFSYTPEEESEIRDRIHNFVVASPKWFPEGSTAENCAKVLEDVISWETGKAIDAEIALSRFGKMFRSIGYEAVLADDVFLQSLADKELDDLELGKIVCGEKGFLNGFEIPTPVEGSAVRFLVDFGNMVVGDHELDLEAPEGTVIDVHNFEFIQRNGRKNYAEGMNNTFRYICREGRQSYRSVIRRGFRYSWITVRNASGPVRFHKINAHFVAYPQKHVGKFSSNDNYLDRIWNVGAHTLRCCAEDTYTDCPTYEQVFWVGDGRNEALVDWMINGDSRLWYRCLRLAGESLERSAITESHLPSADRSILPAWTFLWMRSCREYLLYTGDFPGAVQLFRFIRRNFEGIRQCLNEDNLFEIQAWNMFDWAEMDTPDEGVVTHNNCFLVLALNETADLADWLEESHWAEVFRAQALKVKAAINKHLWCESAGAFVDCVHKDGKPSKVFSQQTQAVAVRAGVPENEERANLCRGHVFDPPDHFVKSGSPFFQFFILEILALDGLSQKLLDSIREHWGFMIDEGASTFWEMWSLRTGRLTRSHCHGWSAAPTFFLSSEVLGIQPLSPGFSRIRFAPQLADLNEANGTIPTPHGLIEVELRRSGDQVVGKIKVPDGVEISEIEGVEISMEAAT
ncbi:MAG: family 78 glycoside hydrolase catalytic domain [Puniceicoccaceae bacterium]